MSKRFIALQTCLVEGQGTETRLITLDEAPDYLQKMLAGESRGRVLVKMSEE